MSVFNIQHGGFLHKKLVMQYRESKITTWPNYLMLIDENIVSVERNGDMDTFLTFKSDEHKTWFILRWS
jgi:uncharacterized beta-barrel protein YwiB (DUF1934 family)